MSLYGALSSGVSGLKGQANAIGVISDNISNVNTIGYKSSSGIFETLVTNSGTLAYSPGGVLGRSRASISEQGLLTTTNSNTDIAISGKGMFVVSTGTDETGTVYYTRAGSFRQDATGNFRNAAGYYLQGWPLDREGRLPGESGNANTTSSTSLTSLQTINVSALTGSAAATTKISLSANLRSAEVAYPGSGVTADMDALSSNNIQISAEDIIIPTSVNSLTRGDKFQVTTGNGLNYTYTYGGFTYSKSVLTGDPGDDGKALPPSPVTLGASPFTTVGAADKTVSVRHGNHGLTTGDTITISGINAIIDGIPAAEFNNSFIVTVTDKDNYTIEMETAATAGSVAGGGTSVSVDIHPFASTILDASTVTGAFLGTTGTSIFTTAALTFTINTETTGTSTFTYASGTPNAQLGQFNSLNSLASAIEAVDGLTARVVNGVLYVGTVNANDAITFANGDADGEGSGTALKRGIDWIEELGIKNVSSGTNRFSTLQGLGDVVNDSDGLSATVNSPDGITTVDIFVDDPLDTITFSDRPISTATTTFSGGTPVRTNGSGSKVVTMTHTASHGFTNGDIITLDGTGLTNYPSAVAPDFDTTLGSATITINDATHTFTNGDNIFIDGSSLTSYPTGTVNGIPLYEFYGNFTVSNVVGGTSYDITLSTAATSTASYTPGTGTYIPSPTFGGIPYTDFNGQFEIINATSVTYDIVVTHASNAVATNFAADALVVEAPTNGGSVLAELGMVASLNSSAFTAQTTGSLGPAYDATNPDKNMAGGAITPQYFTNIRIFDSLGTGHDLRTAFIKTGINTWAIEVFSVPAEDVSASFVDGLLASGTISFNGDGSLRSVSAGLASSVTATWTNGAEASSIELNWGTAGPAISTNPAVPGGTDGLSQFDAAYKLNFVNQNGVPVGELIGVEIDELGVVIARYNNGEEQALFKIPIADFANPDGLRAITGNVFSETAESGTINLREPGTSGTGLIQASALESSNAELSEQLTTMIVVQRAYQANTRTITTADSLLEELNNILR